MSAGRSTPSAPTTPPGATSVTACGASSTFGCVSARYQSLENRIRLQPSVWSGVSAAPQRRIRHAALAGAVRASRWQPAIAHGLRCGEAGQLEAVVHRLAQRALRQRDAAVERLLGGHDRAIGLRQHPLRRALEDRQPLDVGLDPRHELDGRGAGADHRDARGRGGRGRGPSARSGRPSRRTRRGRAGRGAPARSTARSRRSARGGPVAARSCGCASAARRRPSRRSSTSAPRDDVLQHAVLARDGRARTPGSPAGARTAGPTPGSARTRTSRAPTARRRRSRDTCCPATSRRPRWRARTRRRRRCRRVAAWSRRRSRSGRRRRSPRARRPARYSHRS